MTCHPYIEAQLELESAAAPFLRKAGSHREREALRDAIADARRCALEFSVMAIAAGHGELTVDVFREVVKRAHELGLPWQELATAFHQAQGAE